MKACLKVLEVKAEEVGATDQANHDFHGGDNEMKEKNNEKACEIIGEEGEEPSNQNKDQFQVVNLWEYGFHELDPLKLYFYLYYESYY